MASWNSSQRLSWLTRIRSEGRQYCHWGRERLHAGTCSILDIENISEAPEFLCACPVPPAVLRAAFGSEEPDRLAIERGWDRSEAFEDYFGDIGRASACYVLIYDGGRASEVFFAGWSAD